jgi:hypothetical protein
MTLLICFIGLVVDRFDERIRLFDDELICFSFVKDLFCKYCRS